MKNFNLRKISDMKTYRNLLCVAAVAAAFAGCSKENVSIYEAPETGEKVQISVTLPETVGTKVGMSELQDGSALELKWEADDKIIVVSGDVSEEYSIVAGYTDKYATFEGNAVTGDTYDIILSKSGADYRSRSYHAQTQAGNGSCDHLAYDAWLTGVDTYAAIDFSQTWAADHGGNFHQNGVVKFRLKFPETVSSVSELILAAPSQIFYADNDAVKYDNVHVTVTDGTLSEQILTAYVMTSSNEVAIADNVELTLSAVTDAGIYVKEFAPGKNLVPGKMNVIQLNDQNWMKAAEGTGTEADPYLLRTVSDLQGMSGKEGYFKLVNDIDLTGVVWTPVCDGTKTVNFDGNGKTISNLTCSTGKASFFGKFKGSCNNVSFTDAVINGTKDICGIVAGEANGSFSGVNVSGTVTSGLRRTGGIVGYLTGGSMEKCKAKVCVESTGGNNVGGIVGQAYGTGEIKECSLEAGSEVVSAGLNAGGIAGYSNMPILDCTVKNSNVYGTGAVGGIVGESISNISDCVCNTVTVSGTSKCEKAGLIVGSVAGESGESVISQCAVARGSVTCYRMAGGIVGCTTNALTINNSYSHNCAITATERRAGGILGVGAVASDKVIRVYRCYSTASVTALYTAGGITGYDSTKNGKNVYSECVAWNSKIKQTSDTQTYSSGAIVGYCGTTYTLSDCIRKGDLNFVVPDALSASRPVNQENCDGVNTLLTNGTYADNNYGWKYLYPYHGKSTELTTVSAVAKSLSWDETTIWNLEGDLPTLR